MGHRAMWLRVMLIAGGLALGWTNQAVAGDAAAGQGAYAVCAACHGPQGQGNQAMAAPKLAGQEDWYIKRQIELYKIGARGTAPGDTYGAQMRPMAMTLGSEEVVDNLIAYIQTFPDEPAPVTVEGDVAAGKAAYMVCAACHGANAEGNQALGGPGLAGQNDWYLVRQIQNYRNNLRGYDPRDTYGAQMKPMANTLATDEAINNVVAYINSLQ